MASPQTKEFLSRIRRRPQSPNPSTSPSSSASTIGISASISIPTSPKSSSPSPCSSLSPSSSFSPSKQSFHSHSHEPTVEFYLSPPRLFPTAPTLTTSTPPSHTLMSISAPTGATPSTTPPPPLPISSTPTAALASDPERTRKNTSYSEGRLVTFEGSFIKLFAQDGMELIIPREVAFHSEWMRRLLTPFPLPSSFHPSTPSRLPESSSYSFSSSSSSSSSSSPSAFPLSPWKERAEGFISLPTFRGEVLEKVVQYCFSDYLLNGPPPPLSPPLAKATPLFSSFSSSLHSSASTLLPSSFPPSSSSSTPKSPSCSSSTPTPSSSVRRKSISRLAARGSPTTNTGVRRSLFRENTPEPSSPTPSGVLPSNSASSPFSTPSTPSYSNKRSTSTPLVSTTSTSRGQGEERDPRKERIVFCIDIGGDLATEVLMAAHYLSIRGLHDLACRMIAANIEGIETLVGLPPESVLQIFSYLPPVKLLYAEQHSGLYPSTTTTSAQTTTMAMTSSSPFLQQHHQFHSSSSSSHRNPNSNNGFFDTGFLWKRAFEREGWGVDEYPYENSWKVSLLKMVIHNDPAVCDIHPTIHRLASHRFISPDGVISTLSKKKNKKGGAGRAGREGEEEEDTGSDEDRPLHESDIFGKRDEGIPWKHLYLQREFQNRVDRYFRTLDVAAASGASQYPSLRATLLAPRVEFGVTTSSSHSPSRDNPFSSLTSALNTAGVISHKSPPPNLSSSNSRNYPSQVLETDFVGCISIPSIVGDEKSVSMVEKEVTARKLRLSWADGLSDFIRTFENLHFLDLSNHSCLFNAFNNRSGSTSSTSLSSLEGMLSQEGDALIQWLTSESRISSLRFSNCGLGDGFTQKLLELTSSCSSSTYFVASSSPSPVGRRKRSGILAWTSLDLSHNNLTSKGLHSLCQVLFPNISSSPSSASSSTSSTSLATSNYSLLPLKLVNISLAENKIKSSWRPNVENVLSQVCFALSRSDSLRMLDLRRNEFHLSQISLNALEALATNSSLTYLLLDGNTFMGGQVSASSTTSTSSLSPPILPKSVASPDSIRTFLSYLPLSLQHLGLSNCGLSSIHLGFLVSNLNKGMDSQRHITSLDLSDNNFRDSGVFISTLLKQYQSLTSLDLGDSHLWDVGGTAIANSLADNPSLTYLNLERNTLRHSSLAVASSVANHRDVSNLRTLNLDDNQMSTSVQNQVKSLLANTSINLILNS